MTAFENKLIEVLENIDRDLAYIRCELGKVSDSIGTINRNDEDNDSMLDVLKNLVAATAWSDSEKDKLIEKIRREKEC